MDPQALNAMQVCLLGPGLLQQNGVALRTHSAKALVLLAHLVLEGERAHARDKLAALLWPDLPAAAARQGLRQAVYALRGAGDGRLSPCLQADRDLLRWVPQPGVEVDVSRFLAAVQGLQPTAWREAAALYRAPLLEGRSLPPCADHPDWLAGARERLHALALQNLERLARGCIAAQDWTGALQHVRQLTDIDPTSEAAFRDQCRILVATGRRDALHAAWQRLCTRLREDLDVAPTPETAAVYAALSGRAAADAIPAKPAGAAGAAGAAAALPAASRGLSADDEIDALLRAGRAATRVHAFGQTIDLCERALRVLDRSGVAASPRRCALLLLKEAALERLGQRGAQIETLNLALAVAAALGDSGSSAALLLRRAAACAYLGRTDAAREDAWRALQLYRGLADRPGEAEALRELGFVHWRAQDPATALVHAREALRLHRQMADLAGEASALHNLAEIQRGLGALRQAAEGFAQAMQLHWSSGNRSGEILSLFGWGHALHQGGDAPGARQKYTAALALAEQTGERTMQARALHALAMHHAVQGDHGPAVDLLSRAIEIDRAIGYAHGLGHDLGDLSDLHRLRGERLQARAALQEAVVWFGFTEDEAAIADCQQRLDTLDAGGVDPAPPLRRWIRSHLALGEGKAYCEFESGRSGADRAPGAVAAPATAL
jgi:DNA-binding SARP family transcriptional activator/Tfp pilus assembly protein PilF